MASLRIELFPTHLDRAIHFYITAFNFTLAQYEPETPPPIEVSPTSNLPTDFSTRVHTPSSQGYAYLIRKDGSTTSSDPGIRLGLATKQLTEYPDTARDLARRKQFRMWPIGVEIVLEVEDLQAERERMVKSAPRAMVEDLKYQSWGMWDFRVVDSDGYYWRITSAYEEATRRAGEYARSLGFESQEYEA